MEIIPVSYTHLDVYKRQLYMLLEMVRMVKTDNLELFQIGRLTYISSQTLNQINLLLEFLNLEG